MKRSVRGMLLAAGLITATGAAILAWPPPKGSPQSIIRMTKNGATESQLLEAVDQGKQAFDLSADEVIRLKQANVPDTVIVEMLKKKALLKNMNSPKPSNSSEAARPAPTSDQANSD